MKVNRAAIIGLVLMSGVACSKKRGEDKRPFINRLTDVSHSWERGKAIEEMEQWEPAAKEKLVPELVAKLSDKNNYVRQNAADALGVLDQAALPAVPDLEKVTHDRNTETALMAKVSLARMGVSVEPTLNILIERLSPKNQYLTRYSAANYVGFIASGFLKPNVKAAIPALIDALQDSNQPVRERAAWALGSAGPQAASAVDALKETVWDDSSRNVRYLSSFALKQIDTPAAKKALDGWVLTDKENQK